MNDEESYRIRGVVLIAGYIAVMVVGMAFLGIAAFLAAAFALGELSNIAMEPTDESEEDIRNTAVMIVTIGTFVSCIIGGVIGLVIAPAVEWLLRGTKRQLRALAAIIALSMLPTVVWAVFLPDLFGITASVPAVASVIALCAFHGVRYRRRNLPNRCPNCQYDLRDRVHAGCPECGWGRSGQSLPV